MIRQWSELPRGKSRIGLESGFDIRKRSSVLAFPQSDQGYEINCERSFAIAKVSASRPAGLPICGEWVSQFGL